MTYDLSLLTFSVCFNAQRGWAAWLTAAVDERVVGVIPIVLSCLNMVPVRAGDTGIIKGN